MAAMLMLGLLLITLTLSHLDFTVAQIGVNYGRNGDGLLPPAQAVELYKQNNIRRMRIYDTDRETLQALRGSDIELTVGILNRDLQGLDAGAWVRDNILAYHPDVKFRYIVVGNEVRPGKPDTEQFVPLVLPAMQSIYDALPDELKGSIKVTTAVDTEILEPGSGFPPENGKFSSQVAPYLNPIVQFLVDKDAPLFVSIYPYFAYIYNPQIDLRYALLDPTYPGVSTPSGTYQNLFYALLDAVNAALEKSVDSMSLDISTDGVKKGPLGPVGGESGWSSQRGGVGASKLASTDDVGSGSKNESATVHVGKNRFRKPRQGESGWPPAPPGGGASTDDVADDAASVDNARAYVNNLIQAVKNGTPRRPGKPIETYIFAMFDENLKPGNEEERNFGLFRPDGQPKYQVNFN